MEDHPGAMVVGMKQVLRSVHSEKCSKVFLAEDADEHIKQKVISACQLQGVEIQAVSSMQELGSACGIKVGAAAASLLKE